MKKIVVLFSVYILSAAVAVAGGFQINLQGQKQAGMGHTGTGLVLDNSCVLFNPGAMSFLDSLRGVSAGTSLIFPKTTFVEQYPGNYSTSTLLHIGTPITFYAAFKFKKLDKFTFGLGIYNPFGSRLEWPEAWKGQFLIKSIDLKTFFIQPTVSYKVNEKLGIGAGFVYGTGDFILSKAIPTQDSLGNYGEGKLNGKANGFGFNAGVYYQVNEKLSIGVDYRSQVKVKVKNGSADFTVPNALTEYFPSTTFSTTLKLPQMLTIGVGYKVSEKLKLALDINFVGWKSYDSLIIDFAQNTDKLADIHSARMYQNTFIYRVGAQYQLTNSWTVRLGTYYDMTPVKNGYFTPETPDVNKIGITSGASYRINRKLNVDFSLLFIEGMKRTDTSIETGFGGTYKSRAVVPGFSLGYRF